MVGQDLRVVFRYYQPSDYDQVAALWSRINRELAPAGMEELFEQYIATTISGELVRLSEVFSEAKKNAFWVVDHQAGSSAALVSSLTVRPTPNYAGCIWTEISAAQVLPNTCSNARKSWHARSASARCS